MTLLKHHNNLTTNWYMRKIFARGVEVGGMRKSVTIVYNHVSKSALAYNSLYAI